MPESIKTGDKNKKIIYNSRTGATASIDMEYVDEKGLSLKEALLSSKDPKSKEIVEMLKAGEFIISSRIDEKSLIRFEYLKAKFSTNSLDLTIIPTLDCNFACIYCYEKGLSNKEYIGKENKEAIVAFVREQATVISNLHVTWYGGRTSFSSFYNRIINRKNFEDLLYA